MNDYDEDWWTQEAMMRFGGSFVKLLGEAARHADAQNHAKVKASWPEYWAKYKAMGVQLRLKETLNPHTP